MLIYSYIYIDLFISPSGISDPCGTVAGMVTPKGSMSTEGETLQISVLPYRIDICRVTKVHISSICKLGQKLGVYLPLLISSPSA
jgi:hypothetical protein